MALCCSHRSLQYNRDGGGGQARQLDASAAALQTRYYRTRPNRQWRKQRGLVLHALWSQDTSCLSSNAFLQGFVGKGGDLGKNAVVILAESFQVSEAMVEKIKVDLLDQDIK